MIYYRQKIRKKCNDIKNYCRKSGKREFLSGTYTEKLIFMWSKKKFLGMGLPHNSYTKT